ncbi:MAG: ribonuclease HII [Patescibacteria group bacterium]
MKYPNFNEEKKLWKKGYKYIAGLDEAGRGPLAGPVVAAAVVILNPNDQIPMTNKIINIKAQKNFGHWTLGFGISEIKDSKQLSYKKREQLYDIITTNQNIKWGVGIVSEKVIDKINILEATKLAMKKSIKNLNPDFLLIDGNFKINIDEAASAPPWRRFGEPKQKSIIKGDSKVFSISAASIIAKVTRDRIMKKEHKKYPQYGFDGHKGYGTAFHFKMIKKHGSCKIHRKSFWPVSSYNNAK